MEQVGLSGIGNLGWGAAALLGGKLSLWTATVQKDLRRFALYRLLLRHLAWV